MNPTATVPQGAHENTVMHGDLRVPVCMTVNGRVGTESRVLVPCSRGM